MSSNPTPSRPDTALITTGLALFVLPLAAIVIKLAWPGWMLFFVLLASPVLLIGYAVQAIIASTGFFGKRALFRVGVKPSGNGRARAFGAAWLTSVAVLLTALFFVDGGDVDWGSAFMYIVGQASNDDLGNISGALSIFFGIIWVGGWVWLLVEWILAISAQRKRRVTGGTPT